MKTKYNSTLLAADAKGGDQTRNSSIRRKWSALVLGGFLFTSIFALLASPVEAECKQWSVGHGWRLKQGSINVDLNLQQKGSVITGTATHDLHRKGSDLLMGGYGGTTTVAGTVDGTVEGDSFDVKIYWDNDTIGVYNGTIRASGKIEGKGWEQKSRRTKVNWYSETRMVCADARLLPRRQSNPPARRPTLRRSQLSPPAKSGRTPHLRRSLRRLLLPSTPIPESLPFPTGNLRLRSR